MERIDDLLTEGLTSGFAGDKKSARVWRGPFSVKSSSKDTPVGGSYRDEWISGSRIGGGQEIAQIGEEKATRLYAGGIIKAELLTELGITKDDVLGYLRAKILELGNRTRLATDCNPEPDGDWQYAYQILQRLEEISLIVALETITFKNTGVFAHAFLYSLIK